MLYLMETLTVFIFVTPNTLTR